MPGVPPEPRGERQPWNCLETSVIHGVLSGKLKEAADRTGPFPLPAGLSDCSTQVLASLGWRQRTRETLTPAGAAPALPSRPLLPTGSLPLTPVCNSGGISRTHPR